MLGEVGRAIREIQGSERGGDALQRFGAFLFHSFHFHAAGEPIYLIQTSTARHLVSASFDSTGWDGDLPADSGYLQLPSHLFWSAPGEGDAAEPIDGLFWTRAARGTLALLVALGLRRGRPGISVTELPPVSLSGAQRWPIEQVRADGEDFSTLLPGGELDQLYSVGTMGEVLKLVGRTFAYMAAIPEALGPTETSSGSPADSELQPTAPPSAIPFRRVRPPATEGGPPDQTERPHA